MHIIQQYACFDETDQFTVENSTSTIIKNTKFSAKKILLSSSRCLTVFSFTFMLYNNPTLNNCFHFSEVAARSCC